MVIGGTGQWFFVHLESVVGNAQASQHDPEIHESSPRRILATTIDTRLVGTFYILYYSIISAWFFPSAFNREP